MKIKSVILESDKVARTINRLAHEIIESVNNLEDVILVGIRTRGVPLAERLKESIKKFAGVDVNMGILDITLYRDDLSLINDHPIINSTEIPFSIYDKTIILVDDVLYTGRTIRAAIEALMELGRAKCIKLAVMIDRGHRELPIRADYIGKNIPTSSQENVKVKFLEVDGVDLVELYDNLTKE